MRIPMYTMRAQSVFLAAQCNFIFGAPVFLREFGPLLRRCRGNSPGACQNFGRNHP